MSSVPTSTEHRVVLRSVSWKTYLALVEESTCGSGRMTYDQGVLEIMSPGMPHEMAKRLIGRMIETFTLHHEIEIRSASSTTFRLDELQRGFEADESYYIQNAIKVRGIAEIELTLQPPPDLVVEIDLTHSSISKRKLFAAMQIPEVWRYDGQSLWLGGLHEGDYIDLAKSRALPAFPCGLAAELLSRQVHENETVLIRTFLKSL